MNREIDVALFFKTADSARIQKVLEELGQKSIGHDGIPHITLGIFHSFNDERIKVVFRRWVADVTRLQVRFAALTLFPGDSFSICLQPTANLKLITMQKNCIDIFSQNGCISSEYYQPDMWIPHCSLIRRVKQDDIAKALSLLRACRFPITAEVDTVALIDAESNMRLDSQPLS